MKKRKTQLIENTYQIKISLFQNLGLIGKSANEVGSIVLATGEKQLTIDYKIQVVEREKIILYLVFDNIVNGEPVKKVQKIKIACKDSNLGIGRRFYFECPICKRNCLTLHKSHVSMVFKHRLAYNNRLYYKSQLVSKRNRSCKYIELEIELKKLKSDFKKGIYPPGKSRIWVLGKMTDLKEKIRIRKENFNIRLNNMKDQKGIGFVKFALSNSPEWTGKL